ncbi:hypothetical protein NDU88_003547 [Pleurodeles waltl]|uniref:Reverse transcriptase domain-containing protein n=1 Tax=Pleurodeles waltl TaxID=8319 RepID=A0AAV7PD57_PLEWA|nr:hypothetical protein NDU88_003547 [Pleurodeles waltl]
MLPIRSGSYQTMPLSFWNVKHVPKPAISLWRLWSDLLSDPKYKQDLQGALNGYFSTNWSTATARGVEWESLKVVIRGESLSKTYGIRKHLDQELTRQEDVLTALQCQIYNGDASESACIEVRGRIVELWDRLDSYVRWNYRLRLYREGDRPGHMLARLLQREVPPPIIQMLRGPSGEIILGQLWVNSHLREQLRAHLRAVYAAPCGVDVTWKGEYLDGLRLPRLTETQSKELEGEVSLDKLMLHEARGAGLVPENMREALIVMLPKPGKAVDDPGSYGPLSMLNVDVKLLAKVLASRLSRVVTHLVQSDQCGFIPWMGTHMNIRRLAHRLHEIRGSVFPAALVALDMEKAFNMLSWEYLWEVMCRMGIGPVFLFWVRLLYTAPQARVRTGAIVSESFTIECGTAVRVGYGASGHMTTIWVGWVGHLCGG